MLEPVTAMVDAKLFDCSNYEISNSALVGPLWTLLHHKERDLDQTLETVHRSHLYLCIVSSVWSKSRSL